MMAYYYRAYVSNEGLLLQRVRLQWMLTITESKPPMKAYCYRELVYQWLLTSTESKTAMKAYYYRE